jgi:hypothetical protein
MGFGLLNGNTEMASFQIINTTGAAKGILRLPHRWQRVVNTAGDYTEGQ